MNGNEKKVPKRRFKEFQNADNWEQRKVTDVGKIFIGLVTTMTKYYTDSGTLLIRNSDIKDGRFEFGKDPIYLEQTFAEENSSRMHQLGDVITVHTGDVGTSAVITKKEENTIGFATIVTRPIKQIIDSNYLSTFLNTEQHKKWAVAMSTGDGRTNYNLGDYYKLIVPVPSLEEQSKIATFISKINNLITLHQRKLDKLKSLKKAYLTDMFPAKGESKPKLRFAGFTDDWEQRKVGELCEVVAGGTPNTSNEKYWNPKLIPWLSSGEVHKKRINYTDNMISQEGFENSSAKWVKENSVLIALAGQGKTRGTVAINNISLTTNQSIAAMVPADELSYEYLFQNLESRYAEIRSLSSADGSRGGLNKQMVSDITIKLPHIEEQQQIGIFFCKIDNLIALHQRKLEKLQNIKKAYLNEMFV